ncbi:MAG: protein kinase [Anaerolineae bacterium]|nr:protein kinase [Anaerolineae bacterium]
MTQVTRLVADRFEIYERIGQGGMGDVYRGVDLQTGRPVAVKHLKLDALAARPDAGSLVARFRREGEALRRLNHPNIVKMLDAIEIDGQHYIVMEYVGGGSLHDLIRARHPLALDRVLGIALELADALTRAHHLGVIHRDLKPANVLMDPDTGAPRLTDFGVAHVAGYTHVTQTGSVIGTDYYLSPEACYGQELDAHADIWSFGVMIYEMLTGRPPFHYTQPAAIITAILTEPVPDPAQFRTDIPPALASLLGRMLEKNREDRIRSVRQVGAALEAVIRGIDPAESPGVRALVDVLGGESRFPTPLTPSGPAGAPARRHNLPAQSTPFIGRRTELREIAERLDDPACRLLTLIGPGGGGKTRLAIQTAAEKLDEFPHGAYFVSLASLTCTDYLVTTVAEALRFTFEGQDEPLAELVNYLRGKRLLLIMDNFEHLLDGSALLGEILSAAPGVKAIATSRERLNIQGEWLYTVGGMRYPRDGAAGDIEEYTAVRLFVASARRVRPNFTPTGADKPHIVRICRLVDGLPLGLELAASWLQMLSCAEIADEIESGLDFLSAATRDIPERHRSLRAVFDYSWGLLSPHEQAVMRQLSVFRGGFERDAAAGVTQATLPALLRLVGKSLLHRMPSGRYEMHGLLRQYAAEKLNAQPDEQDHTLDRHSAYYAEYTHQHDDSRRQREFRRAIEAEIENLRAAWEWAVVRVRWEDIDRLKNAMSFLYGILSLPKEGSEVLGKAIVQLEPFAGQSPDAVRIFAALLNYYFWGCFNLGRIDEAAQAIQDSLALARSVEDEGGVAWGLVGLANVERHWGEFDAAQDYLDEALAAARAHGDKNLLANVLNHFGDFLWLVGRHEQGKQMLEESLALSQQTGNKLTMARTYNGLGVIALWMKDYEEALRLYARSQETREAVGLSSAAGSCNNNIGLVLYSMGKYEEAARVLQDSLDFYTEQGNRWGAIYPLTNLGHTRNAMGQYGEAKRYYYEALTRLVEINNIPIILEVIAGIARADAGQGSFERAAERVAFAQYHPAATQEVRVLSGPLLAELEAALAPGTFEAAVARGRAHLLGALVQTILQTPPYL